MLTVQFLIIAFAIFALSRAIVRFREGSLTRGWLVFWCLLWAAVGVAAVLPQTTSRFAALIGVGRGVDAVVYVSVIVLFYVVFRIFLRLEKIEHDITVLVRHIGLMKKGEGAERRRGGEEDL